MRETKLALLLVSIIGTLFFVGSYSTASPVHSYAPPSNPVPSASPIQLILEESGPTADQVAAIDASMYFRDPFLVRNPANLLSGAANYNSLVGIFVLNLVLGPGETASDVIVNLIDNTNRSFDVPAEAVFPVPGFDFTEVIFKLPDDISPGECTVRVKWGNQVTNPGKLRIRRPKPKVTTSPSAETAGVPTIRIYLPDNCPAEFTITNSGPSGSNLDYVVADNGVLGGFLNVEHASGSLPSGVTRLSASR